MFGVRCSGVLKIISYGLFRILQTVQQWVLELFSGFRISVRAKIRHVPAMGKAHQCHPTGDECFSHRVRCAKGEQHAARPKRLTDACTGVIQQRMGDMRQVSPNGVRYRNVCNDCTTGWVTWRMMTRNLRTTYCKRITTRGVNSHHERAMELLWNWKNHGERTVKPR